MLSTRSLALQMLRWTGSVLLILLVVACGDDSQTDGDADALAASDADSGSGGEADGIAVADASTDAATGVEVEGEFAVCSDDERVGGFTLELLEEYTTVIGQVANGVSPLLVLETVVEAGDCRFARPVNYFCDPTCIGGDTCTANGECVPSPSNGSVGAVSVTGASGDFEMAARAPVYFYTFNGDLPHPAFDASSVVELVAEGDGDVGGFQVSAHGVDALVSGLHNPSLAAGEALTLAWVPSDAEGGLEDTRILVDLNIANHGGAPGRIECETLDDGELTVSAELVDALLANGYSGFPSLVLSRVGAGSVGIEAGCVDLRLVSLRAFAVVIPGLTSCSNDDDCPTDESCQPDLSCG
jgi:hypothetical protein